MLFASIKRTDFLEKETLGRFTLQGWDREDLISLDTLELSWKNNRSGESCIPEGEYEVRIREAYESGSFDYKHLKVYDPKFENEVIKGNGYTRKYILIHAGNYYDQIAGCILLGSRRRDINGDGIIDITNSRDSLQSVLDKMKNKGEDRFQLKIYS